MKKRIIVIVSIIYFLVLVNASSQERSNDYIVRKLDQKINYQIDLYLNLNTYIAFPYLITNIETVYNSEAESYEKVFYNQIYRKDRGAIISANGQMLNIKYLKFEDGYNATFYVFLSNNKIQPIHLNYINEEAKTITIYEFER